MTREGSAGTRRARRSSFDVARVAAICGVVAIHIFGLMVTNEANRGSGAWWVAVAIDLGFIWAVPLFVMLSGALVLAPSAHKNGILPFYRKRAIRILPAIIAWNLIYLLLVRVAIRGEAPSLRYLIEMVYDGKIYTQLYFLWIVLGLYLLAPVLAAFLRDGGPARARIFALVAIVSTVLIFTLPNVTALAGIDRPISLSMFTMWIPYVGYFVAGYALASVELTLRARVLAALATVVLLSLIIWQYGVSPDYPLLQAALPVGYYGPIVAIVTVLVFVLMLSVFDRVQFSARATSVLKALSDASFGVFLVHLALLAIIQRIAPDAVSGVSLIPTSLLYVVVLAGSYAIAILAARVPGLRRIF